MALLTRVETSPDVSGGVSITVDRRRTLLVLCMGFSPLVVATYLHIIDQEWPAAWFTGMGEGILFAGFGILVGEMLGAREAAEKVYERTVARQSVASVDPT